MPIDKNGKGMRLRNAAVLGMLGCIGSTAQAVDLSYGARFSSEYSNNFLLLPDNERDEWRNGIELDLGVSDRSRHLDTDIRVSSSYYAYAEDTVNNESVNFVNGLATLKIRPQRFTWLLQDTLGEGVIDSLAGDSRANRQRINIFNTGPDFVFRLGPSNTLNLGARVSRESYEVTQTDSTRKVVRGSWAYQRSASLTLSANATGMRVDFDDDVLNEDYDRGEAYLQANARLSRTTVEARAGAVKVDRDRSGDVNDVNARVTLDYRPSSTTRFSWTSLRRVSDSALEFLGASETGFVGSPDFSSGTSFGTAPVTGTDTTATPAPTDTALTGGRSIADQAAVGDVFLLLRHSLGADYTGSQGSTALSVYVESRDYEEVLLDYEAVGVTLDLSSSITAGWRARFSAAYSNTDNSDIDRTDKDATVDIAGDYVPFRYGLLSIYSRYNRRNSDDANSDYKEWAVGASFAYRR